MAGRDPEKQRQRELWGKGLLIVGVLIGLTGCAYEVWLWSYLLDFPRGTSIRPMGAAALSFDTGCRSALIGLPISIAGLILARRLWKKLGVLAIILCLAPIPLGAFLLQFFADLRGLNISQ